MKGFPIRKKNIQRRGYLLNIFLDFAENIDGKSNLRICLHNIFVYIVCLHNYKTCTQFLLNMRKLLHCLRLSSLSPSLLPFCVCVSRWALSGWTSWDQKTCLCFDWYPLPALGQNITRTVNTWFLPDFKRPKSQHTVGIMLFVLSGII